MSLVSYATPDLLDQEVVLCGLRLSDSGFCTNPDSRNAMDIKEKLSSIKGHLLSHVMKPI